MTNPICPVCSYFLKTEGESEDCSEGCPVCGYYWQHSYGAYRCYIGEREFVWSYREPNDEWNQRRNEMHAATQAWRTAIGLGSVDFEAFSKTIRDNPNDHATRAVFADWLEDRGCLFLAEYHRHKIPAEATP